MMFYWVSFWGVIYFTNVTFCLGLCNLSRLKQNSTSQSSVYTYENENPKVPLTAEKAVDGKFLNHIQGECAGTGTEQDDIVKPAWWKIALPELSNIYKINLMFRENVTRHNDFKVYINTKDVNIKNMNVTKLPGMNLVYHDTDRGPSSQFIMIFPVGIIGKHMIIYKSYDKDNILDICEVEIWGCINHTIEENCTCSQDENETFVPQGWPRDEMLTSVVAWPHTPNKVTLKCHKGNVVLQNDKDRCEFKPKCVLEYRNQSVLFFCSACKYVAYNGDTVYAQNLRPFYTLNVGDNVTYICKRGYRLTAGNLIRICQENGSWTGEEPNCERCKCPCKRLASQNFIKDPIVLQERVEEIKKILEVNRSELSAFKRKKISSYDGRATSTGLGMTLGVGVITFVIGAIVCGDLLTCKGRRRRRAFRKV